MPRLIKEVQGKLVKCMYADAKVPYTDWRRAFMDVDSRIEIYESEVKCPGKVFIYIYPKGYEDFQSYLHTSYGDIEYTENGCILTTWSSIYEFIFNKDMGTASKKETKKNKRKGV